MHTVNKVFMFAIVLDTHVEILFISGDLEGGFSITLYSSIDFRLTPALSLIVEHDNIRKLQNNNINIEFFMIYYF